MGTSVGAISERNARPGPSGSGSWYTSPAYSRRSPRATVRTMSIVSRVAVTGARKRTPCHPSMTCGPLVPSPSRKRPFESDCIDIADIANIAGVLAPTCTMPEPSLIVVVLAARYANGVSASCPQASGAHTDVAPSFSASTTKSASPGVDTTAPIPTCMLVTSSMLGAIVNLHTYAANAACHQGDDRGAPRAALQRLPHRGGHCDDRGVARRRVG